MDARQIARAALEFHDKRRLAGVDDPTSDLPTTEGHDDED